MLVVLVTLVGIFVGACGGNKGIRPVSRYEGKLATRGNDPKPQLMLELDDGGLVEIRSKDLQVELTALAGLRVAVEGDITDRGKDDMPIFDARRYYLLRLPSGEMPLVGTLAVDGEDLVLTGTDGVRYWIRGDFAAALRAFDQGKVWVVGSFSDATGDGPPGARPYWVTGYGILDEGISRP
jgi:hypothetical protein